MSHPAAAFPFAYLLPPDATRQSHDTRPALATTGSPRRRLVVLVLTLLALAAGLAALLPSGDAPAMIEHQCLYDPAADTKSTNDPLPCF